MDKEYDRKHFGILTTETFYEQKDNYKTIGKLILAIDDYY